MLTRSREQRINLRGIRAHASPPIPRWIRVERRAPTVSLQPLQGRHVEHTLQLTRVPPSLACSQLRA
eukprot:2572777-Prymnesium_polylepis.1